MIFGGEGSESEKLDFVAKIMIVLGICTFCTIVSGIKVVYGRYAIECSEVWGQKINVRAAWLIQVTACVVQLIQNISSRSCGLPAADASFYLSILTGVA